MSMDGRHSGAPGGSAPVPADGALSWPIGGALKGQSLAAPYTRLFGSDGSGMCSGCRRGMNKIGLLSAGRHWRVVAAGGVADAIPGSVGGRCANAASPICAVNESQKQGVGLLIPSPQPSPGGRGYCDALGLGSGQSRSRRLRFSFWVTEEGPLWYFRNDRSN